MNAPAKIGKYDVTGELGKGAMGVVYSGVDPVIHRDVALKVLRKADLAPEDAPSLLERFKREAQAAGKLNHPNIVAIYEYGEDDEYAFIAMECVTGKSLREHLQAGYRPEMRDFPDILVQLLEGLEYSHSRGVVHRDIKPANILISEMGVAKISDFGIARLETSHLTMMGEVLGTPFYMPPEQFNGESVDERSDIYSAGVIVFEVLTGRRPFDGTTAALVRKVLGDAPPKPSSLDPRLTPALDRVILQALAKKPANRFSSARAFLHALQSAFDNRPVDALGSAMHADASIEDTLPNGTGTVVARLGALRKSLAQPAAAAGGDADASPAAQVGAAPAKKDGPTRKARVLFVDDEERVVNALRAIFRDTYEVETATSGEQALALVRSGKFHVIVSDQRMPGMLGVDFLREAKALSPESVRLLLTGYSDLAAIVGSVNDGEVYRFVSKPWNQDDLQQTMGEAVTIAIALEASPPPRTAVQKKDDLAVIVLDDAAMARATREMAGDLCRVLPASTLEEALQLLAENEVAVLVADLESKRVDNTVLFKLLKQEHPETLVVVTTRASDSELIISLINEARIFRFINKPVNLSLLQNHLVAALERYLAFKASPELMATQRARRTEEVRDSTLGRSILDKLKGLGSRLTGALRGGA
jgi:response regulator RpfG family c-di-GMP phosphodiesterase/predicted Ser/Thr protein kinase